jgi:thiamine transport system ATP-binding protein
MSEVSLNGVCVSYGESQAVRDVSFDLASGRRLAILGPSGCGKSSLLRVVAGLEPLAAGRVAVAGQDQSNIPTFRRGMGLMFQDHALFPHLDVAGNVGFGLRMAKWQRAELKTRVSEMLELVGLTAHAHSQVADLSGGEQQRVALARTLAPRPKVVLLDEPLGSLDRVMREDLMSTMTDVFDATGATVIFVTHDQYEASAVGNDVAVMKTGRFRQVAPAKDLWSRPADAWVARFLGLTNVFPPHTRIADSQVSPDSQFLLRPDLLKIGEPMDSGTKDSARVRFSRPAGDWLGSIPGTVVDSVFRGGFSAVKVSVTLSEPVTSPWDPAPSGSARGCEADTELVVWVMGDPPRVGQRVVVSVPKAAILELPSG